MILTLEEVPRAADAFPTKFLDIKNHHVLLGGQDPFADLEVTQEQLRLRSEQELRNMLLRLRRRYISVGDDELLLGQALVRIARPLAIELEALLRLAGKEVPLENRTKAVFDAAAAAFGLDGQSLASLAELRHRELPTGDVRRLFHAVLDAIGRAADAADRMKELTP